MAENISLPIPASPDIDFPDNTFGLVQVVGESPAYRGK
jgi:hypothetical protein